MVKKYKTFVIIGVVILLIFGALFFLKNNSLVFWRGDGVISEIADRIDNEKENPGNNSNLKIYRNEEWGFEFEYPNGWNFHENTFYNGSSKFNLVGSAPEEGGNPNPINPSVLVNIVTDDFAEKAATDREKIGSTISTISVAGLLVVKYEYIEQMPKISVDISQNQRRFIISSPKKYETVLNQILSSFRFIDN